MEKQYERFNVVAAGIMNSIFFWQWRRIFSHRGLNLKMEAEGSYETLTNIYQNIWQHIKRAKIFMEKHLLQASYNKPNYFPVINYVNRKQYQQLPNTYKIPYSRPCWRVTTWNEHICFFFMSHASRFLDEKEFTLLPHNPSQYKDAS